MKIGITGASGFVGGQLIHAINHRPGWSVIGFTRSPERAIPGCAETRGLGNGADFRGLDAVINLAGASIFRYWTPEAKKKLVASRVDTTHAMVEAIGKLPTGERPRVLISVSGTGYYGDRGHHLLDDNAPMGAGFLPELCQAWEAEALKAESLGLRVILGRTGIVLGDDGGGFGLMRLPFSLGLGAQLGHGRQYMSWVHAQDLVGLFLHALENDAVRGPLNVVGRVPITNRDFAKALAHALFAPVFLAVPTFVLKLVLGEASAMLMDSARTIPTKALETGYTFKYPDAPSALRALAG